MRPPGLPPLGRDLPGHGRAREDWADPRRAQPSPDISEKHYNLARSMKASQRHATTIANMRAKLHVRAEAERG